MVLPDVLLALATCERRRDISRRNDDEIGPADRVTDHPTFGQARERRGCGGHCAAPLPELEIRGDEARQADVVERDQIRRVEPDHEAGPGLRHRAR